LAVPEISRFYGIVIAMFHDEHGPPHFHAWHGEYKIRVMIESGETRGRFPVHALYHVRAWAVIHRAQLLENWRLLRANKPPRRIAPLE
jgi:hypothetical protein